MGDVIGKYNNYRGVIVDGAAWINTTQTWNIGTGVRTNYSGSDFLSPITNSYYTGNNIAELLGSWDVGYALTTSGTVIGTGGGLAGYHT